MCSSEHRYETDFIPGLRAPPRRLPGRDRKAHHETHHERTNSEKRSPRRFRFPGNDGGFRWSGRQDLNLRPLAPQGHPAVSHGEAQPGTAKHPVEVTDVSGTARTHAEPPGAYRTTPFGAPVARPSEGVFLTPAEVAARLRVSRATVYALIERCELVARRGGLALRVGTEELEAFLRGR